MASTVEFHIRFEGEFYNDYKVHFERLVYDPNKIIDYAMVTEFIQSADFNVETIDLDNFDASQVYTIEAEEGQ